MEKEKSIPIPPSPIPMFPRVRIQDEHTVIRSFPVREIRKHPTANVTRYRPMKPAIEETVSEERESPPILILVTAFGWSLLRLEVPHSLKITAILMTLGPPPALPAQPPMKERMKRIIWEHIGQFWYWVEEKPVVVVKEITWKREWRIASPPFIPACTIRFKATKRDAVRTIRE